MTRKLTAALVLAAALVLSTAACGGSSSSSAESSSSTTTTTEAASGGGGTLEGEVGPGFTIEVKMNGEDAESVAAGTYTLKVEDKSSSHDFHLIGPGVDDTVTTVPFSGEKTVSVALKKGTYTYQCDPHASAGMKGTFTVT
jgi:plastocyanin